MTPPDPPTGADPRSAGAPRSWAVRLPLGGLILVCGCLCIGIAWPNFRDMAQKAKRAEIPPNLEAIRSAELAHIRDQGRPLAAGPAPVAVGALQRGQQEWPPGTAFDILGWAPASRVRGTYEVRLTRDGAGFTVHGWIDSDGDGVPAHMTLDPSGEVRLRSPEDVY